MYAQLGDLKWERTSYFTGTEETHRWEYAQHDVIGGKPHLQATGDGLDEFSMEMRFHVSWCDPKAVLAKLVEVCARKQAQALVYGDGTYRGKFVVTDIVATRLQDGPDGTPMCLDVKLNLKEFVDQAPLTTARAKQQAQAPARVKPGGKPKPQTHKTSGGGKPSFTTQTTTNPDGFSVRKIVRQP
jgi:phage protein U